MHTVKRSYYHVHSIVYITIKSYSHVSNIRGPTTKKDHDKILLPREKFDANITMRCRYQAKIVIESYYHA